ncbi:uncharacterized protein LOC119937566 [Tachyglossus aculeatus]|uniref:uncharacterized protein LOC119937566 n=1 Tax=Tachyglossus aculeatus TaxID=9261 RepID=UPI0018F3A2C4|nr:uncharacterized protein LOC119937566 [Tachyglossus aculeatus]
MIRCLCCETKIRTAQFFGPQDGRTNKCHSPAPTPSGITRHRASSNPGFLLQGKGEGKNKVARTPDPTICVDLSYSEEDEVTSQSASKTTTSAKATPRNVAWDGNAFPEVFQPPPSNKMQSLEPMDFLQDNCPSFDLTETGYDWKACMAAINSTIRSLRHDRKKATTGFRRKVVLTASNDKSPPRSPSLGKPQEKDPIRLMD